MIMGEQRVAQWVYYWKVHVDVQALDVSAWL
jgi:hypothetical protein